MIKTLTKLLILLTVWFPVTLLLFTFSFYNLIHYDKHKINYYRKIREVAAKDLITDPTSPTPMNLIPTQDIRILVLQKFLNDYKSPLSENVEDLITTADNYGIDYALLPAIALQESGGCKNIPDSSFNCWGYGIYGNKLTKFNSYKEAMLQVAKTIKETYIKNGLTNPTLLEDRWAPQSEGIWSYGVNYFIGKIREYEKIFSAS